MNTVNMVILMLITCIMNVLTWLWISMSSHIASMQRSRKGITYLATL